MNEQTHISQSNIFFSCTEKKQVVTEHFIPEHLLVHVHSGKIIVQEADKTYTISVGESMLFARNQLAKFTKLPADDMPFKSVTIYFFQSQLQKYFSINTSTGQNDKLLKTKHFDKHPLLYSLFNSILPYYDLAENLSEDLAEMKLTEAITILRKIDKSTESILGDFGEPGKIDIADFMQKNYAFNISIERFAYLTGRSLATFKRDFQKVFGMPPKKWLHQKRLEQAHFLIAQKKQKPSDVYLEVGFENLSHFSFAFKQAFGYNASGLLMSHSTNHL
jgi:AraC-like DNA-binding protein